MSKKIPVRNQDDFTDGTYDYEKAAELEEAYSTKPLSNLTDYSSIAKEAGKNKNDFKEIAQDMTLIGISEDTIEECLLMMSDPLTVQRKMKVRSILNFICNLRINARMEPFEIEDLFEEMASFQSLLKKVKNGSFHLTPNEQTAITLWQFGLGFNFQDSAKKMKIRKETMGKLIKSACEKIFGAEFDLSELYSLRGGSNGKN